MSGTRRPGWAKVGRWPVTGQYLQDFPDPELPQLKVTHQRKMNEWVAEGVTNNYGHTHVSAELNCGKHSDFKRYVYRQCQGNSSDRNVGCKWDLAATQYDVKFNPGVIGDVVNYCQICSAERAGHKAPTGNKVKNVGYQRFEQVCLAYEPECQASFDRALDRLIFTPRGLTKSQWGTALQDCATIGEAYRRTTPSQWLTDRARILRNMGENALDEIARRKATLKAEAAKEAARQERIRSQEAARLELEESKRRQDELERRKKEAQKAAMQAERTAFASSSGRYNQSVPSTTTRRPLPQGYPPPTNNASTTAGQSTSAAPGSDRRGGGAGGGARGTENSVTGKGKQKFARKPGSWSAF